MSITNFKLIGNPPPETPFSTQFPIFLIFLQIFLFLVIVIVFDLENLPDHRSVGHKMLICNSVSLLILPGILNIYEIQHLGSFPARPLPSSSVVFFDLCDTCLLTVIHVIHVIL